MTSRIMLHQQVLLLWLIYSFLTYQVFFFKKVGISGEDAVHRHLTRAPNGWYSILYRHAGPAADVIEIKLRTNI